MNIWSFNIFKIFYCCKKKDDTSDLVMLEERVENAAHITNPIDTGNPTLVNAYFIQAADIMELRSFEDESIKEFFVDIHDKLIQYFVLSCRTIESLENSGNINLGTINNQKNNYLFVRHIFDDNWVEALILKTFTILDLIKRCESVSGSQTIQNTTLSCALNILMDNIMILKKDFDNRSGENIPKSLNYRVLAIYFIVKEVFLL